MLQLGVIRLRLDLMVILSLSFSNTVDLFLVIQFLVHHQILAASIVSHPKAISKGCKLKQWGTSSYTYHLHMNDDLFPWSWLKILIYPWPLRSCSRMLQYVIQKGYHIIKSYLLRVSISNGPFFIKWGLDIPCMFTSSRQEKKIQWDTIRKLEFVYFMMQSSSSDLFAYLWYNMLWGTSFQIH